MKKFNIPTSIQLLFTAVIGFFVLVTWTGCSTTTTTTAAAKSGPTEEFDLADINHDGKLSKNETSDFIVNWVFAVVDTNHDGKITEQEWAHGDPSRLTQFNKRDANKDRSVSKREAFLYARKHGVAAKLIQEADTNHDGHLERSEVMAYAKTHEPED